MKADGQGMGTGVFVLAVLLSAASGCGPGQSASGGVYQPINPNPRPTVCAEALNGDGSCGGPPRAPYPLPLPLPNPLPTACPEDGGCGGPIYGPIGPVTFGSGSTGAGVDPSSKDVLAREQQAQAAAVESRAQGVAAEFNMNLGSATQLVQISDRMSAMKAANGGSLTDDDNQAIAGAVLSTAGISQDEVTTAYANCIKGDKTALDPVLARASANLGMPSSAGLTSQAGSLLGISLSACSSN